MFTSYLSLLSIARLDECDKGNVERLQAQLLRKDSQLTESRLEALSSAHQLHTLRETVANLRGEMTRLVLKIDKRWRCFICICYKYYDQAQGGE